MLKLHSLERRLQVISFLVSLGETPNPVTGPVVRLFPNPVLGGGGGGQSILILLDKEINVMKEDTLRFFSFGYKRKINENESNNSRI